MRATQAGHTLGCMDIARLIGALGVGSVVALGVACSSASGVENASADAAADAGTDAPVAPEAGPAVDATTDATADAPSTEFGGLPPAKPNAPASTATGLRTFAIRSLYIGETTRAGVLSATAWKSFGYNLDGKVTNSQSTDVCQRLPGALADIQSDGELGRDNSFGHNIMPIIFGLVSDPTAVQNAGLAAGSPTTLFQVSGLSMDAAQTNTGLTVDAFATGSFASIAENAGKKPTFTSADSWPVLPSATKSGTVESGAAHRSVDAWVVGGALVARFDQLPIPMLLGTATMALPLRNVVVTARVSNGALTEGTIAGVLPSADMRAAFTAAVDRVSTQFCDPNAKQDLLDLVALSADIGVDGTSLATVRCNAISLGLGFESAPVSEVKTLAPPPVPPPNLCTN